MPAATVAAFGRKAFQALVFQRVPLSLAASCPGVIHPAPSFATTAFSFNDDKATAVA